MAKRNGLKAVADDTSAARARILLVDDDERNLLALSEVLSGLADIVTASSGREALRQLLEGEFAVILLDVFMPGMDGYETAQLIRERQQTARIPIIFLSAVNKETEHLMRGYAMGAVDYVFKPVDAVILQSKVKVFVDLYEMRVEIENKRRREQSLVDAHLRARAEKITVERELRLAEQRQAAIIESLPIVLYLEPLRMERRRPSFVSENLSRVTGYSFADVEAEDDFWESRIHPDDRERVLANLNDRVEGGGWSIHYRWRCAEGHYLHLHDQAVLLRGRNGEPVEFAGSFFDISDRRELENQLLQAQKMDAIGQLTGGVAHDFNNLLASMLGGLHLLQRRLDLGERDKVIVDQMRHAAEQGAELVRRMMAFARKQDLTPASVDPTHLCDSVRGLVSPTLGGRVKVDWHCQKLTRYPFVDKSQLELALVNLIINARDAMPDGGTVSVEIAELHPVQGSEPMIRIEVKDEGQGIPLEIIDRVTEPFFTTKEAGKGTGLGLSMVAGFVQQSGGRFTVNSKPGLGTSIEILLPSTGEAPVQAPATIQVASSIGDLRILLVDDDEAVRTVIGEQLRDLGANVEIAGSGETALELARAAGDKPHVILSDYAMPGMNGLETIRAVRTVLPAIRAVLMTGYADDDALDAHDQHTALVRKPIALNELVAVLGGRPDEPGSSVDSTEPVLRRQSGEA
ncbi:response regulator [Sphingomonas sp. HDW15A]|uniref:response regulator n=1 Tax=Sphingomonas sp. HDW15A TaxID=2714942 RepID=UPI00140A766A|nr:response regulator [Sphingomonas sp. HDW15A]QIK96760.1 response regulator [Sphingomonas sp. HDW15A]